MADPRSEGAGHREEDAGAAIGPGTDDRLPPIPIALVIGVPAVILALWVLLGLIPFFLASQPGAFGGAFGAVNALFSGLALAGVVLAIILQTRELRSLRQQLDRQQARIDESRAASDQTARAQRDLAEALGDQADSLLLASYLEAVAAVLDSPAKARQQKSVELEDLDAVIRALQPRVDAIVGRKVEPRAETDVTANALEEAVRDFRSVLEAHPLTPGDTEAAEAVQSALGRLKDELLAVASEIEGLPFLEHAIGHVDELLDRSVPTDEAMPEAGNRLARFETGIIQMCSEVQRAAQDHRKRSEQGSRSP
jgi:hypothetical protein